MPQKQNSAARRTRLMLETLEDRLCLSSTSHTWDVPWAGTMGLTLQQGQTVHVDIDDTSDTSSIHLTSSGGGFNQTVGPGQHQSFDYVVAFTGESFSVNPTSGAHVGTVTLTAADHISVDDPIDTNVGQALRGEPDWFLGSEGIVVYPFSPFTAQYDSSATGTVTISLNPASGTLTGTVTQSYEDVADPRDPSTIRRVAVFRDLAVTKPGTYTLVATTSDGMKDTSFAFNVIDVPVGTVNFRMIDAGFSGDVQHINFHYAVMPATFAGTFAAGLYRSADKVFDSSDQLVATQNVAGPASTATPLGSFTLATLLTPDVSRPYLLVVADHGKAVQESSETDNVAVLVLPTVTVKAKGELINGVQTFDLMKKAKLFPQVTPTAGIVDSYKIEQRRAGETTWRQVLSVPNPDLPTVGPAKLVQRLAGDVEYRATMTINGVDYQTPDGREMHIEVRFPSIKDIRAAENAGPNQRPFDTWMQEAWNTFVGTPGRRITGFWLTIDTASGWLLASSPRVSDLGSSDEEPDILYLGARPADTFAADGLSGVYVIASVRLHSVWEFVNSSLGSRSVGPTEAETEQAGIFNDDCPAFVLDYKGHEVNGVRQIEAGWKHNKEWKIWKAKVFNPLTGTLVDRRQF